MLRYIHFISVIGIILIAGICAADIPPNLSVLHEIAGEETNSLKPNFLIQKYGTGWTIEIDLTAQTNFLQNSWLKTTNRSGSTLRLWLVNGTEVISTNQSILEAGHLPAETTVADIMRGIYPRSIRALQWWRTEFNGSISGETSPLASFNLQDAFNMSFTNDVVLQITPLVYKVETNEVTAHLVEFQPIKVRLISNGDVRKEE